MLIYWQTSAFMNLVVVKHFCKFAKIYFLFKTISHCMTRVFGWGGWGWGGGRQTRHTAVVRSISDWLVRSNITQTHWQAQWKEVGEGDLSSADKNQISFDNNLNPIWRHTGTIEPGGKNSDKEDGVIRKWHLHGELCAAPPSMSLTLFGWKLIVKFKQT